MNYFFSSLHSYVAETQKLIYIVNRFARPIHPTQKMLMKYASTLFYVQVPHVVYGQNIIASEIRGFGEIFDQK